MYISNLDINDIVYFCEIDNIEKTEQWKQLTDYPNYQISDLGRVKSNSRKKPFILKTRLSVGYNRVRLYNSKTKNNYLFVHRLVAKYFINKSDIENNLFINHKDSNRLNNIVSNLEHITIRENKIHSTLTKNYSSKYTGVSWYKNNNKWKASIMFNGKNIHLGYRNDELEAYQLYLDFKLKNNIVSKY